MERADSQSTKITKDTLRMLRVLSALEGTPQYQVLARLVADAYMQAQQKEHTKAHEAE